MNNLVLVTKQDLTLTLWFFTAVLGAYRGEDYLLFLIPFAKSSPFTQQGYRILGKKNKIEFGQEFVLAPLFVIFMNWKLIFEQYKHDMFIFCLTLGFLGIFDVIWVCCLTCIVLDISTHVLLLFENWKKKKRKKRHKWTTEDIQWHSE